MRIVDVCCRWPGSAHDATIFINSTLCEKLDRRDYGIDVAILGDSAYGPQRYMCKPLANPNTRAEKQYQRAQIRSRNVVERTFGALKRRFPCLALGMRFRREKVQDVVVSCCVLYNFLLDADAIEIEIPQDEIDHQMDVGEQLIAEQQEARGEIRTQNFLLANYFARA